jgi:hypothetical protein
MRSGRACKNYRATVGQDWPLSPQVIDLIGAP